MQADLNRDICFINTYVLQQLYLIWHKILDIAPNIFILLFNILRTQICLGIIIQGKLFNKARILLFLV